MELNKESDIPIYRQLQELIRAQIEQGKLRPGDRLQTEMELCARLGVSRTSVRRALALLAEEGLLVRRPKQGTFLSTGAARGWQSAPQEITITVDEERWCWPLQRAATLWNEEHPEQRIRLSFQIVGHVQLRSKLILAVAQGTATDISLVDSVWVAEFAERGYLQSLESIDAALATRLGADMFPTISRANSCHGELYALQAEADLSLLWYRKDWLAAERLQPPRTWEELVKVGQHFQEPSVRRRYGIGPFPLAFVGGDTAGETTIYQLLPVLWSAGADVISSGEVVLNSVAAQQAVAFIGDLVRSYRLAPLDVASWPWNAPALALAAGSVAMAFGGSYESAMIRAAAGWDDEQFLERVGFVPVPAGPGGGPATLVGGMSYAIYRQSRRPRLALELLSRAVSQQVLHHFCHETGQNPPNMSAARMIEEEGEPFLRETARLLPSARARWPLVEYARVSQQLRAMFESVIVGDSTPEQAVARAAAVISGITGLPEHASTSASWVPAARKRTG